MINDRPTCISNVFLGFPESAIVDDDDFTLVLQEDEKPIQAFSFSRLISTGRDKLFVRLPDAKKSFCEAWQRSTNSGKLQAALQVIDPNVSQGIKTVLQQNGIHV